MSDKTNELAEAAAYRVTPDDYYGTETDEEAVAKAAGFNAAQEIIEPLVTELIAAGRLVGEPTDEQVERAARVMFEDVPGLGGYTWAEMVAEDPERADIWRGDARLALTAAGVAPQVPSVGLRIDDDGLHIYWHDPVEGCWVAFKRVDCVSEEELPSRSLTAPSAPDEHDLAELIRHEPIGAVGSCVCHEAYTSRKRRDPDCEWHCVSPRDDFHMEVATAVAAYLRGESK